LIRRARRFLHVPYTAGRMLGWLSGDRSPFVAALKVTTRCTLQCRHCPWTARPAEDLPLSRWNEIMADLARSGVLHLVIEGGEPTLRDDLEDLIRCGKRHGMRVTVATNAVRPLEAYSPDRFLVSVDGLQDAHDGLRGAGSFERLVKNLETARAPRVALVSIGRLNRDQIRGILDFFADRIEGFWFSFIYDYEKTEPLALSREEKRAVAREILGLMPRYRIVNTPSYLKRVGTTRACRPWMLTTVTADGLKQPGCMVEAVEPCRCDDCDLACHREISDFVEPRFWPGHFLAYLKKPWL
jgi:MoaA/NifB/PqqE/SkfB family radical SAM enzyme